MFQGVTKGKRGAQGRVGVLVVGGYVIECWWGVGADRLNAFDSRVM